MPRANFMKGLRRAPRFEFKTFAAFLKKHYYYCREDKSSQSITTYLESRIWSYKDLYNISKLGDSWYLWRLLNASAP